MTLVQSGLVISDASTTMVSQDPNQLVYSTVGKSNAGGKTSLISIMIFFSALLATIMAEFNGPVNSDVTTLSIASKRTVDPAECGIMHQYAPPTYYKDGASEMLIFKTDDDALSYAESLYLNTSITVDVPLFVEESNMLITDVEITELPITKRWSCSNAPLGTHFTQKQNARYGTWWGPWVAATPCFYTGNGNGGTKTMELQTCRSWSVSAGFSLELVKGLGFSISDDITSQSCKTDTWTCNQGSWALQFWKQQQYVWADQQTQRCYRKHYGNDGCKCSAWGPYIHGDVPTNSITYGCSTDGSVKCNES